MTDQPLPSLPMTATVEGANPPPGGGASSEGSGGAGQRRGKLAAAFSTMMLLIGGLAFGACIALLGGYATRLASEVGGGGNPAADAVAPAAHGAAQGGASGAASSVLSDQAAMAVPGDTASISRFGRAAADITVLHVGVAMVESEPLGARPEQGFFVVVKVKVVATGISFDVSSYDFDVLEPDGSPAPRATPVTAWKPPLYAARLSLAGSTGGALVFDAPARHGLVAYAPHGVPLVEWRF